MNHRAEAKRLLVGYFQTCFRLMGVKWSNDNSVEVEAIIDAIFEGVKREMEDDQACVDGLDLRKW